VLPDDVSATNCIEDPLDATVEATKAFEALRSFRSHFGNVAAELGEGQHELLSFGTTDEVPVETSDGVAMHSEQDALIVDSTPKRRRQRGPISLARRWRRTEAKEAKHIESFLSEFDVESVEKGALERAEDVLYGAAEQRHSFPSAAEVREGFWLRLGEGPRIDLAASETVGVETEADLQGGEAIFSTNPIVSAAPVVYACVNRLEPPMNPVIAETAPNVTNAETAGVEIDLHVGAEPEADHKVMMSARVKNVRKADSMETDCARADEEPAEGFDSTLATVVGTVSITAGAARVHGVQADTVGQVSNKRKARRNAMKSKN
jgi:hypothetical protein